MRTLTCSKASIFCGTPSSRISTSFSGQIFDGLAVDASHTCPRGRSSRRCGRSAGSAPAARPPQARAAMTRQSRATRYSADGRLATGGYVATSRADLRRAASEPRRDLGNERVAVADGQTRRRDGRPNADADMTGRTNALPFRIASRPPWIGHRDDGDLGLDGHDEAALLERQQLPGTAARPFRKNEKRVPVSSESAPLRDGRARPARDRRDRRRRSRPTSNAVFMIGKLPQFRLVEDLEAADAALSNKHRRIDVALVVGAVDDGGRGHMLASGDAFQRIPASAARAARRRAPAGTARPSIAARCPPTTGPTGPAMAMYRRRIRNVGNDQASGRQSIIDASYD